MVGLMLIRIFLSTSTAGFPNKSINPAYDNNNSNNNNKITPDDETINSEFCLFFFFFLSFLYAYVHLAEWIACRLAGVLSSHVSPTLTSRQTDR
jgi:hypothetical protein